MNNAARVMFTGRALNVTNTENGVNQNEWENGFSIYLPNAKKKKEKETPNNFLRRKKIMNYVLVFSSFVSIVYRAVCFAVASVTTFCKLICASNAQALNTLSTHTVCGNWY